MKLYFLKLGVCRIFTLLVIGIWGMYSTGLWAQPIIDGSFEGIGVWGSPIALADGVKGWASTNAKALYFVDDGNYIYLGAEVKASSWKAWAFIINTKSGGGISDSWSRSIDYSHCDLPDFDLRGHFGGYGEFHEWNGTGWTGSALASTEFGENIVTDDQDGWVEVRILKSAIGNPTNIDVQFYITGDENFHGSFDACPDDNNAMSWDESGNRTPLNNYHTTTPTVVVSPPIPNDAEDVTITFDASCTPLEGASKVYLHSGVSTTESDPLAFNRTIGNWGQDDGEGEMTSVGSDQWEIVIPGLRNFYGVVEEEDVFGLNYLFRSADGSIKEDNGGSNYYHDVNTGPYFTISSPGYSPFFQETGSQVDITAISDIIPVSWTLQELDINDNSVINTLANQLGLMTFTHLELISATNQRKFKIIADYGGGVVKYKTLIVQGYDPVTIAPRPGSKEPGIHYNSPTSVTLILHAPTHTIFKDGDGIQTGTNPTAAKKVVHVIGDFNSWTADEASKMYRDTDNDGDTDQGDYWWITLNGLTPGQEYVFQYLIDGNLQVADPYGEKVSDPDDQYISSSVYSDLPTYPMEANDRASVLQTDQMTFNWTALAFTRPSNDKLNIYELHFRDFTEEGTYLAAIDKLDYIKNMGINAIHVMPVSEFEGNSSWGYNPNFYFAPDKAYGPKEDLKKFIDECHKREIQVFNDLVLNHAFYSNVMARMYWNESLNRPADDSPFFNPEHKMVADPAGWWGVDWNHESEHVQKMVDRILDFWLQEYRFDGFRFDFTKGFGQTAQDVNDPWASDPDPSRVKLLKRMVDGMWSRNPGSVAIFEHLAWDAENKELADHGILQWSGVGHHNDVKEFILGWQGQDIYTSGHYQGGTRNFTFANWMSYAESHDEQRLGYEVWNFADVVSMEPDSIERIRLMIDRLKIAAAFNLLFPGPRMLWQFQELGYKVDINYNGRTGEKPVRWVYFNDQKRKELYRLISRLLQLRNNYNLYGSPDYGNTGDGVAGIDECRYMKFDLGGGHHAMVIANLDPRNLRNYNQGFPVTGNWYLYNGDPAIDGNTVNLNITSTFDLDSSEVYLLTTIPLEECGIVSKTMDNISITNTMRSSIDCAQSGDTLYFDYILVGDTLDLTGSITIDKNLVIHNPYASKIIISGKNSNQTLFYISNGIQVELSGIKLICSESSNTSCIKNEGNLLMVDTDVIDINGVPAVSSIELSGNAASLQIKGSVNIFRQ